MPSYRYLLTDLLTEQVLADLPLTGVSFDRRLCRVGSLQGTLSASTPELVAAGRMAHDRAGRSALWVYRDNALWWGGIPWTVKASQGPRGPVKVNLSAATFDSYAHRRRLYLDKTYAQVDQGALIPDLWRQLQFWGSDIGMVAEDQPTGILRDRTYLASEHLWFGKLIEELGDVIDGPEHTVDTYLDSDGSRVKRLRVGMHLGLREPRAVFQRASRGGGRVQTWESTADATAGGTTFTTRGDAANSNVGEAQEPLQSDVVYAHDLLDAGWPRLDMTADHPGVSDKATLDGHAQAMAATHSGAAVVEGYTVEVGNTGWSPNRLGDVVRIKMDDMWHAEGTDEVVRPVACRVTPSDGETPESVQLLLGDD